MIAVLVAICSFLLASSSIPALAPYSTYMRVFGALFVLAPVMWRKRLSERVSYPRFSRAMIASGSGFGLYLGASTMMHGDARGFLLGVISFLLVASLVAALLHYYSAVQVVGGAYAALLVLCVASLLAQRTMPDLALENDRLRGVFENANTLGFVGFAIGLISLAARLLPGQSFLGLGLAVACLSLSGSRASALALICVAVGLAIGRVRRAQLFLAFGLIAVTIAWLMAPGVFEDVTLLRTTDTRSYGFEIMQRAMSESFWNGLGELPMDTRVAGSPFTAGITGGLWGLLGLGIMYFSLISGFVSSRPRAFALVLGAIVHSWFESWLLTFSAPMLLTFFVLLVCCFKLDVADKNDLEEQPLVSAIFRSSRNSNGRGQIQMSFKGV